MSVFKSKEWFSKTEGDGKLVKEIPAEVDGEQVLTSKFVALPGTRININIIILC